MGNIHSGSEGKYEEFPPITTSDWEKKIIEDLKGADYDRKLVWHTLDGFDMRPYYRAEDLEKIAYLESHPGQFPFHRSAKTKDNSWLIRQDINVESPESANADALEAVKNGATSIGFDLKGSEESLEKNLHSLLKGIHLEEVAINFTIQSNYLDCLSLLHAFALKNEKNPGKITGSISLDPLGALATRGNFSKNKDADLKELRECIEFARKNLPSFRVLNIGGDLFHDAGGSITQELAYTLSLGNEYLAELTGMGMKIPDILPVMHFQFSAATSYFMVIAKHRAVRYLWSRISESYDKEAAKNIPMFLHTRSSFWVQTVYDPYVNLLRTTTSSMAAIVGGTDSLQVNPFDSAYKNPGNLSRRIARNTQVILKEESYLDKVIDPSAGSYYIENLTDALINKAWEVFLEVEEQGGFFQSLLGGYIQASVTDMVKNRRERFAMRKDLLLGTNQYPNFGEEMKDEIDPLIYQDASLPAESRIIEPIVRSRSGVEFANLRLKTEAYPGKKPAAFMLTLGNLNMRRARAMFGCNFFASAGFDVIDNTGFTSPEEGVNEAIKAKADIVVLCSSDEEYPSFAKEIAQKLAKDCILVIAGYPKDQIEDLRQAGYNHFIHVRSNVLEELGEFQKLLGIGL
jgi:methylmalonyl-CoA mutase